MPGRRATLFGFFGLPAHVRKSVTKDELCAHCHAQFTRFFGSHAATPTAEFIKDCAPDPFTSTSVAALLMHGANCSAINFCRLYVVL